MIIIIALIIIIIIITIIRFRPSELRHGLRSSTGEIISPVSVVGRSSAGRKYLFLNIFSQKFISAYSDSDVLKKIEPRLVNFVLQIQNSFQMYLRLLQPICKSSSPVSIRHFTINDT